MPSHSHKFLRTVAERSLESGTDNLLQSCCFRVSHLGIPRKPISLSIYLLFLTDLDDCCWSNLNNVPKFTDSCLFEIRGFAGASNPFLSKMSADVSYAFRMRPNASGASRVDKNSFG